MSATQQVVTALIGALMIGTILAMPSQLPGASHAALRNAGSLTPAPQKCPDQGLARN